MNNKMKKFSKILMMTVAILLTLVLASTSVVSGIFAKYAVTKKATTTVSLQKFGLTLQVEGKYGATTSPTGYTGLDVLSVTVDNLQLTPGQPLTDVVKFTIGGKSNVDNKVNMVITATVDVYNPIAVPKDVGGLASATKYLPIAFTADVEGTAKTLYDAWGTPTDAAALQTGIVNGIKSAVNGTASSNAVTVTICDAKNDVSEIDYIYFGFTWDDTKTISGKNLNEISTYLAEKNLSVKVTYTVSLQQA